MIGDFGTALRLGELLTFSENLLEEAASAYYDHTKSEAKIFFPPGCHDDELDAVMIALQVVQSVPVEETTSELQGPMSGYTSNVF